MNHSSSDRKEANLKRQWMIWTGMFLLVLMRIWMGNLRPVTYTSNGFFDDFLLLKMADLKATFHTVDYTTLNKTLSFSWFLNLVSRTPFSLDTAIALYWSAAALSVWWLLKTAKASRAWSFFGFVIVLFCPCAFEDSIGTRLYRNILIAPTIYIFLSLAGILFLACWQKKPRLKTIFSAGMLLACFFPFAYYLKEDGLWMLLSLIVFSLLAAVGLLWQARHFWKRRWRVCLLATIALLLPFVSFARKTSQYVAANKKYYDYPYITVRTGGEMYEFIEKLYTIESKDRSLVYWAPKDTFRQAMAVSPTLAKMDSFTHRVLTGNWISNHGDIPGDFLGWTMLIALHETGSYTSPHDINLLFGKINAEIDQAFQEGKLKKDHRFQITAQAGGRTLPELALLFPDLAKLWSTAIFLNGYGTTIAPVNVQAIPPTFTEVQTRSLLKIWSARLKTDLEPPADDEKALKAWEKSRLPGLKLARLDVRLYRLINPVLILGGILLWILWLCLVASKTIKQPLIKKSGSWLIFLYGGISICYSLALIWFCQFIYFNNPNDSGVVLLMFYGPGLVPMLTLPALLAFSLYRPFSLPAVSSRRRPLPAVRQNR